MPFHPHALMGVAVSVVVAAAAVPEQVVPIPDFVLDANGVPVLLPGPRSGFRCADRTELDPTLATLVTRVQVCALNGVVVEVTFVPRPGRGHSTQRLLNDDRFALYGWHDEVRWSVTETDAIVTWHKTTEDVILGHLGVPTKKKEKPGAVGLGTVAPLPLIGEASED